VPPLILDAPVTETEFVKWFTRCKPDVVLGHNPQAIE